jgi:integrase
VEIFALSERASQSHYPYRDRAMILTSLDTGISATELCNLQAKDLNRITGQIRIRKGKKSVWCQFPVS